MIKKKQIRELFHREIKIWKLRIPVRFLLPIAIVLAAKLIGALYIYYSSNISGFGTFWTRMDTITSAPQNNVFLVNWENQDKWPLTFLGWDSSWYLSIMTKGYDFSSQSFTFSPAFPFIARLLDLSQQSPMISLVLTSLFFGILWIPLYQFFTEEYLGKKKAFLSSLLIAFSPYLFVFTTVAYSESLLMFFSLGALVLFRKNRFWSTAIFALMAPLTRSMGILIVFPMLCYALKKKVQQTRYLLLSLLPIASFVSWWICLGFFYGDLLAPVHTTEWSSMPSLRSIILEVPQQGWNFFLQIFFQPPTLTFDWFLSLVVPIALVFPLFLFRSLWKKDRSLWLYAVAGYGGILFFGALASVARFISVLFPFWIPLLPDFSVKKVGLIIFVCFIVVCYIFSIFLWQSFLSGRFIA